jgi:hypothetical protein
MAKAVKKHKFTPEQLTSAKEAFSDFESFCEKHLKILDFQGKLIPFKLNTPQRRFIRTVLKQWKDTGMIRVVITKARKMGFTTVITAFLFWITVTKKNKMALAGTHLEDTNSVLVGIYKRFAENYPEKLLPTVKDDNASGMSFKHTGSSYSVKTASNTENVGRGFTGQMLHISEIAHIDNAEKLPASLFSAVADEDDSMIFLESTANGMGNYHHSLFLQAERRDPGCEYIAFFAPWFEDDRYQKEVPPGFILTDEEKKEKALYNLTDRQIAWRRSKLATMGKTPKQALAQFKQEYPANSTEAFQYSAVDSYLEADLILEAMNRPPYRSYGAIVAGFDPSNKGKDRDAFIYRQGANMWGLETPMFGEDFEARVAFLKRKLDGPIKIDMLFIDAGGGGYQLVSRLHSDNDGYRKRVRYIESGSLADNQLIAHLKRDEMFVNFLELLTDKHAPLSIDVGDKRDIFLQDLTATGYTTDQKNRPKMESKEHMKARGVRSTDLTDAATLTTAQLIVRNHVMRSRRGNFAQDDTPVFGSLNAGGRR